MSGGLCTVGVFLLHAQEFKEATRNRCGGCSTAREGVGVLCSFHLMFLQYTAHCLSLRNISSHVPIYYTTVHGTFLYAADRRMMILNLLRFGEADTQTRNPLFWLRRVGVGGM
jgi:hypothetical protein